MFSQSAAACLASKLLAMSSDHKGSSAHTEDEAHGEEVLRDSDYLVSLQAVGEPMFANMPEEVKARFGSFVHLCTDAAAVRPGGHLCEPLLRGGGPNGDFLEGAKESDLRLFFTSTVNI